MSASDALIRRQRVLSGVRRSRMTAAEMKESAAAVPSPSAATRNAPLPVPPHASTNLNTTASMVDSQRSGTALPLSSAADTSFSSSTSSAASVISGTARIADLHPHEKSKIGALLQEIVQLKKETLQREQRHQQELRRTVDNIKHESETEAQRLREEYEQSQREIREYQERIEAMKNDAEKKQQAMRRHTSTTTTPASASTATTVPESANVTRLHRLSDRVARAATGTLSPSYPYPLSSVPVKFTPSPLAAAASNHSSKHTSPDTPATIPAANDPLPFSTLLRTLASSPYKPLSTNGLTRPATKRHSATTSSTTDDEHPRSITHLPVPNSRSYHVADALLQRPQPLLRDNESHQSISPRRRLDLEVPHSPPAASTSVRFSSPLPAHSNNSASKRASTSATHTTSRTLAATAAAASLDQIERRAVQLAQEMYQRKLEEEERNAQLNKLAVANLTKTHEGVSQNHQPHPQLPQHQHPTNSTLSSFFRENPLTNDLTPIKPRTQAKLQRSNKKQRTESVPLREASPQRNSTPPSPPPAQPQPPSDATKMLHKSIQLAQSYAEERREREDALRSSAGRRDSTHTPERSNSPIFFEPIAAAAPTVGLTPTTRKIHRFLAIQNPAIQQDATLNQKAEQEFRIKEEKMIREAQEKKKQELVELEMRAKRPQIQPNRSQQPPQTSHRIQSVADSYVPAPFSYRNPSRNTSRIEAHQPQPIRPSPDLSTISPRSDRSSSTYSYGTTPITHANTHVSFMSPADSHANQAVATRHESEDTEIFDLFHLKSPSNLQHQFEAHDRVIQHTHPSTASSQLERDLESMVPHVLRELTQKRLPPQPHSTHAYQPTYYKQISHPQVHPQQQHFNPSNMHRPPPPSATWSYQPQQKLAVIHPEMNDLMESFDIIQQLQD